MPKMNEDRLTAAIATARKKRSESQGKGTPEEQRAVRKRDKRAARKLKNRLGTLASYARQQSKASESKS